MSEVRHSEAHEAEILSDPQLRAQQEVLNGLRQFKLVTEIVQATLDTGRPFRLRPSHLQSLHRVALLGLSSYAGVWRPAGVTIGQSKHLPPDAFLVPERIEELCDYVNENWNRSALQLASYVMWRLNWIHPFTDGNGRTSRAASYLVLCLRMGYLLPGRVTIPEQIESDKTPYYRALESADRAWSDGFIDLSEMKHLLGAMLATQLLGVYEESEQDK